MDFAFLGMAKLKNTLIKYNQPAGSLQITLRMMGRLLSSSNNNFIMTFLLSQEFYILNTHDAGFSVAVPLDIEKFKIVSPFEGLVNTSPITCFVLTLSPSFT